MEDLIPLDDICKKYFGLTPKIARRKAALGTLPIPAFRLGGGRKGPLYIRKEDWDKLVADRSSKAETLNNQMRLAGAV